MASEVITILKRYEALVKAEKIANFTVSLQTNVLLVRSSDGSNEQKIEIDKETLESLKMFFYGIDTIQYNSYDYVSLVSIINAKMILERMLHNKNLSE